MIRTYATIDRPTCDTLQFYTGYAHWFDPAPATVQMLQVGNGKLTIAEDRAHFGLCLFLRSVQNLVLFGSITHDFGS